MPPLSVSKTMIFLLRGKKKEKQNKTKNPKRRKNKG